MVSTHTFVHTYLSCFVRNMLLPSSERPKPSIHHGITPEVRDCTISIIWDGTFLYPEIHTLKIQIFVHAPVLATQHTVVEKGQENCNKPSQ